MTLRPIDWIIFIIVAGAVRIFSLHFERKQAAGNSSYFVASKTLSWWSLGLTLIAANVSLELVLGLTGRGYASGLSAASYEWLAAIAIAFGAAIVFPKFIAAGIVTIPEYFERRFGNSTRLTLAMVTFFVIIFVNIACSLYSGGLIISTILGFDFIKAVWFLAALAAVFNVVGGIGATIYAQIIQGSLLLVMSVTIMLLALTKIGGPIEFFQAARDEMHTVMPLHHEELPWPAVFFGGMWIAQINAWVLNQAIYQRSLAARDIKECQKGLMFLAFLKFLTPFLLICPGIIARHILPVALPQSDLAFPGLINALLPDWTLGFVLAILFGAQMSALDTNIGAAATIFTFDIAKASQALGRMDPKLVGKATVVLAAILSAAFAPNIAKTGSVFVFAQEMGGLVSCGVTAAFLFGWFTKRRPRYGAVGAIIISGLSYTLLLIFYSHIAFLYRMAIAFLLGIGCLTALSWQQARNVEIILPQEIERPATFNLMRTLVALATIAIFAAFY